VPPEDAANLDLARQTIVLRAGNREREFTQGRVIIGRSRDVDFRIDDPNVSRRHAAVFWSEGRIVVEDLDSTNGTMVNGYPVSSTAIRTGDKIVIGDCHITVETR
jgi:pSer/pThr/pTyr-binding forkhead associated (FHA) protein